MTLAIRPLSDALGAEVVGADLTAPLTAKDAVAVEEAFLEHHLLCFRSQALSPQDFLRVGRYFGEPQLQLIRKRRNPEVPEVLMLESTYKKPEDKPDDLVSVRLGGWHTDDSYFEVPAKATMLQSLAIPSSGGQTRFCNMRRAYEKLPEETKQRLDGLKAVHGYDTPRAPGRPVPRTQEEIDETPDVVHPLVRTHDDTRRKSLYFNQNRTDRIVGMERAESDAVLDMVFEAITQPDNRYDHEWRLGDILLWDNRCLVHSVNMDFPVGEPRRHQRILLKGSRPV